MDILTTSQIILNVTLSLVGIMIAIIIMVIAHRTIKLIKNIKRFSHTFFEESAGLYNRLDKFLVAIVSLPFVSQFIKKRKANKNSKGRSQE